MHQHRSGSQRRYECGIPVASSSDNDDNGDIDTSPFSVTSDQQQQQQDRTMDITSRIKEVQLQSVTQPLTNDTMDLYSTTKSSVRTIHHSRIIEESTIPIQSSYVPRTIRSDNQERLSVLPTYPNTIYNDQFDLLLANVPIHLLNEDELQCRLSGKYDCGFIIKKNNAYTSSFLINQFKTYYEYLIEHLQVDVVIFDYNYNRLKYCMELLNDEYIRRFGDKSCKYNFQHDLDEKEYPLALEYYLQMDVDLFYMKTCSYRQAKPNSLSNGLFCIEIPECRYTMTPCGQCQLCQPSNDITHRPQPAVEFGLYQKHRFINDYESILNCPASCNTDNIIYVLTCPCGHFEYIGETSKTLKERLAIHRANGNRIIHEFLLGEKNITRIQTSETSAKDHLPLYQHATHCSVVMQMFLNCNPQYWCFVPMELYECEQNNIKYQNVPSLSSNQLNSPPSELRNENRIRLCMKQLPRIPQVYQYSHRQYDQQYQFFKQKQDYILPDNRLDLYNVSLIAVLPSDASPLFRKLIQALFITHTEAKLNIFGHLVKRNSDITTTNDIVPGAWCQNLIRHPRSTSTLVHRRA